MHQAIDTAIVAEMRSEDVTLRMRTLVEQQVAKFVTTEEFDTMLRQGIDQATFGSNVDRELDRNDELDGDDG